jgi:hypothetical protein
MSITYIYNSSTINLFVTEDLGSLSSTQTTEDYGSISAAHTQEENYFEVQYTGDVIPFGTITVGGSGGTQKSSIYPFATSGRFRFTFQGASTFLTHAWTGSGSLFEIGGGLERIVAPYLGADPLGGITLFNTSGSAGESFSTIYTIEDTTTLSTEDYGSVSVGGSSVDYGQITSPVLGETDYGRVDAYFAVPYEGTISITGSGAESFTESGYLGTGSYGGFSGSASISIPRRYEGYGNLFSIGGGEEEKTYRWGSQGALFSIGGGTSSANSFRLQGPIYIEGGADSCASFRNISTGSLFGFSGSTDSVTKDYDLDNILTVSTEDYGLVTSSVTTIEDYGSISSRTSSYGDFGTIIYTQTTFSTTGGFTLSGSADTKYIIKAEFVGSGSLFSIGGEANSFIPNWNSTGLFAITGSSQSNVFRQFESIGILSTTGGEANSHTVVYNKDINVTFSTEDRGLITSVATNYEDLGVITQTPNSVDNGQVVFLGAPFGGMTLGGTGAGAPQRTFVHEGFASITTSGAATNVQFAPGPWKGDGLFAVSGVGSESYIPNWSGVGVFTTDGDKSERSVKDYNDSLVNIFSTEDNGSVATTATSTEDYGSITQNAALEDNGFIFITQTDVAASGTISVTGSAVTSNPRLQQFVSIGGGILFNISGGEGKFIPGYIGSGSINISGNTIPNFCLGFIGDYNFTLTGGNVGEEVTKDYNDDFVTWDLYRESEFGTISTNPQPPRDTIYPVGEPVVSLPNSTHDFGSVSDSNIQRYYEFGRVAIVSDTKSASGTYTMSGSASPEFVPEFAQIGTGLFRITGASPNSFFPTWNAFGTLNVTGQPTYNFSLTNPGSGALFANGISGEAITSSYNLSSIDSFNAEDYGSITGTLSTGIVQINVPANDTTIFDTSTYNEVVLSSGGTGIGETGGFNIGEHLRFGQDLSGSVGSFRSIETKLVDSTTWESLDFEVIRGNDVNGGEEPDSGENLVLEYYDSSAGGYVLIGIILAENSTDGVNSTVAKNVVLPLAARAVGTRFRISSSGTGSTTGQYDHYGLKQLTINTGVPATLDYEYVTEIATEAEDYGSIFYGNQSNIPFGLFRITGAAETALLRRPIIVGSGTYTTSGNGSFKFLPNWNTTGLFAISGSATTPYSLREVSTGTLFTIGDTAHRVAFDYNESSIAVFITEDNGSVTTPQSAVQSQDNGSITAPLTGGEVDNGYVVFNATNGSPFGGINISGSASKEFKPEFAQIGTGLFAITGQGVDSFFPNWNGSGTIQTSGGDQFRFSLLHPGSGGLFSIGGAAEAVTKDYNEFSIDVFNTEDYGALTSTPTTTNDYEYVTDPSTSVNLDYGNLFTRGQNNEPFGLFRISGSAQTAKILRGIETGSGSLFTASGAAEAFQLEYTSTGLFSFSGSAIQQAILRNISEGSLFTIGGAAESVTFDYTKDSIAVFVTEDNGSVATTATSTEDYGSIVAPLTGGEVDNGYVVFNNTNNTPFGSISITGSTSYEFKPEFAQIGTGLFAITGQAQDSFFPNWNGSGSIALSGNPKYNFSLLQPGIVTIFTNGIAGEAITKFYSATSVDVFDTEDYGSVPVTATTTNDYEYVSDPSTSVNLDYGNLFTRGQDNEPFGLFKISGSAITAGLVKPKYTGSGTAFVFRGAAYAFVPNWNSTGLFRFSGAATTPYSLREVSTGTLFTIGSTTHCVAFDYNETSIATFSSTDNGSVATTATSTEDYGSITAPLTGGEVDNGYVVFNATNGTPFGGITIGSAADTVYAPEFGQTGYALFAVTGSGSVQFIPNWNGSGTIQTSGGDGYVFSLTNPGSGGLFSIGGAAEAVVKDYNISSRDIYSTVDYGALSATPTSTEDYDYVTDPSTSLNLDFGNLITQGQTNEPFGLFQISGAAETAKILNLAFVGSGSLFTTSGAAEAVTSNPPENTVLFNFTGSTVPNFSFRQSANAFLTLDAQNEERRTYDYNQDTVIPFYTEDLGLVSNVSTTNEDNGLLADPITAYEDRGYIRYTTQVRAASGTIKITGDNTPDFLPENAHVGSGSIIISGAARREFIPNWVGTGLFSLTGGDQFRFSLLHVATGGLFTSGIGGEAVTKFYSATSIDPFNVEDYGSITSTPTTTNDYEYVTDPSTSVNLDFGNLNTRGQSNVPFGTITISGSADVFFQPFRGGESTVLFQFSGSRDFEQFIPNWNSSGGITISGTAGQVAELDFPYTGTGALFANGIGGEAVVKDYSATSILPFNTEDYGQITAVPTTTADYESITDGSTQDLDYRYIWEYPGYGIPFGTITISGNNSVNVNFIRAPWAASGNYTILSNFQTPMEEAFGVEAPASGVIYLGFASADTDRTRAYDGSGSLFATSGAAESKTSNPPENTVLFTFGGSAETPRTRPYIGSGSLFVLSSATEAVAVAPEATGLFTISGTADTDRTRDFVGSGSLFSVGGAAEAVAVAPETTGLFTIGGSGDPPIITLKFVGGGTITVSGTVGESFTPATEIGSGSLFSFGGAAESKTSDEEFTGLYTFSGTAEPVIRTRGYQGSGQITVSGTAVERQLDHYTGSGVFQVTGIATAQESYAPAAEIGSGSIFTVGGSAESKTSNPPENTILYTFTGTAEPIIRTHAFQGSGTINISGQLGLKVILNYFGSGGITLSGTVGESFTPATEVGSGSITISGTKDESFTKGNYTGSGSITLSGAAVEKQTDDYVGTGSATISGVAGIKIEIIITGGGSLFSTGGAAEAKASNTPENTILYALSGVVGESFTPATAVGTGSTSFSGAGIEKQTDDYVGTGSATLSGTADTDRTRAFAGSGSLFSTGGAAEVAAVDYESVGLFSILGSANEAIVPFIPPGSGSVFVSGAGVEKQTDDYVGTGSYGGFSGQATDIKLSYGHQGTGEITLSGSAVERQADDYVGTGSLFTTSGAAESKTSNPPENTVLFSFSGTVTESATFDEVSPGGTIVLSGQATNIRFNRGWTGSGSAAFSGSAVERQADDYVGSGTLFATSGAAESKTSNPPENIVLYTFSGTAGDQKLTFNEVASGSITLSGAAVERQTDGYAGFAAITVTGSASVPLVKDFVGSGRIIKFSAFQGTRYAKVVDLPESTVLYSISGTALVEGISSYRGSGSLFAVGGAVESKTTNKPESTVLFNFSGTSTESRTNDYVGSGSLFMVGGAAESATVSEESTGLFRLSGAADTDRSRAYSGSGTLFGFSGAAESATVAEDSTGLFTISGAAETPRARDYVGSGSLFGIGGAAESKTTNLPSVGLFQISGAAVPKILLHYTGTGTIIISGNAAEAFVRPTYIGSGSFGGFSGSADESKTSDEEFTGTTAISGEATDIKLTYGFQGSGSLFTSGGTAEVAVADYENTVLFIIGGTGTEEFIPGSYTGSGQVTTSGNADTELRVFQPGFTFVTII